LTGNIAVAIFRLHGGMLGRDNKPSFDEEKTYAVI
jgi:hypothetical protein